MTYSAVAAALPHVPLGSGGRKPARGALADWPRCGRCHVGRSGALCRGNWLWLRLPGWYAQGLLSSPRPRLALRGGVRRDGEK